MWLPIDYAGINRRFGFLSSIHTSSGGIFELNRIESVGITIEKVIIIVGRIDIIIIIIATDGVFGEWRRHG